MTPERKITPDVLNIPNGFEVDILEPNRRSLFSYVKSDVHPITRSTNTQVGGLRQKLSFYTLELSPKEGELIISSSEDPAILIEKGASICHALLIIEENGNALGYHSHSMYSQTKEELLKTHMRENYQGEKRIILTTGLHNSIDPQQEIHRIQNVYRNTAKIVTPPTPTSGFVFIPKEFSTSEKPTILLIPASDNTSISELIFQDYHERR